MNRLLCDVLLLLWVFGAVGTTGPASGHGDTTTITSTSSPASITNSALSLGVTDISPPSGHGTCPSRTINYITHTLPRQCLRTDRVPQNATVVIVTARKDRLSSINPAAISGPEQESTARSSRAGDVQTTSSPESASITSHDGAASSATTSPYSTDSTTELSAEEEPDSPLDNANFLSFEDWKKQNLAKTGQSLEDIGRAQPVNLNRPRPGINNALDTLGEESEIDLDFTGFGGAAKPLLSDHQQDRISSASDTSVGQHEGSSVLRSKDAGKTCKERTNYASFDCSATILKSNRECKSASSVLVENKDSYMLNTCSAQNKFFIVQLCNDIQIDTIVLANYEFFSSSFRHFRVSVSDRYPVEMEKWKDLGTFEARNTREIQAFLVENPIIWAKYLRIEFLSHYGTEYYCPVSLLRVHGTTMIEDYRHQEYIAQGEVEAVTLEAEVLATPAVTPVTVETIVDVAASSVPHTSSEKQILTKNTASLDSQDAAATVAETVQSSITPAATNASASLSDESNSSMQMGSYEPSNANTTYETPSTTSNGIAENAVPSLDADPSSSSAIKIQETLSAHGVSESKSDHINASSTVNASPTVSSLPRNLTAISTTETTSSLSVDTPSMNNSSSSSESQLANATTATVTMQQATQTANSTRTAASPPPAQPSTQESFFKSFAKRLSQLESNSTLSLQYIEEQSRILREAFSKVERRQVATTTKFLSQLNETVMADLHGFRQAYDQLWQSTVIELDGQRDSYQREMFAMSSRLTMVADELVWQKRMGIVQSTLLLLCLALVLFGRSGNGYLEMPLMQQMINRSKRWEYSEPNSPSPDSRSPVSLFRRKLWRTKSEPAGETPNLSDAEGSLAPVEQRGPDVVIEPPSPHRGHGEEGHDSEMSTDVEKPVEVGPEQQQQPPGHKRNRSRKKKKKPPNWPQGNGVVSARSPLAM